MATRFYFGSSTTPSIAPAFHPSWGSTGSSSRFVLTTAKVGSAIASGSAISMADGTIYGLDRQFVSSPLVAQTVDGATTFFSGQLMTREIATDDNVDYLVSSIAVFSGDGSTKRFELFAWAGYGTIAEFTTSVTHRNCTFGNGAFDAETYGSPAAATYSIQEGDVLVVELGYGCFSGVGTTPTAAGKYGDNATDLPVDDTQTTDGAGWIEITHDFVFQTSSVLDPMGASGFFGA